MSFVLISYTEILPLTVTSDGRLVLPPIPGLRVKIPDPYDIFPFVLNPRTHAELSTYVEMEFPLEFCATILYEEFVADAIRNPFALADMISRPYRGTPIVLSPKLEPFARRDTAYEPFTRFIL